MIDTIREELNEVLDDLDVAMRAMAADPTIGPRLRADTLRDVRTVLTELVRRLPAPDEPRCLRCGAPESEQAAACGGDCPTCQACHGNCQTPRAPIAPPLMREDSDIDF